MRALILGGLACLAAVAATAAERPKLPDQMPAPSFRPGQMTTPEPPKEPAPAVQSQEQDPQTDAGPADAPTPTAKPQTNAAEPQSDATREKPHRPAKGPAPVIDLPPGAGDIVQGPPPDLGGPAKDASMPAVELACRAALKKLGAKFEEAEPASDPAGCRMDHPIELTRLSSDITVGPGLLVNCQTAEAAARFTTEIISKLAKAEFGSDIVSIAQASGYVCRPRNGTNKLSEHAFGNAWDVASVKLANGKVIDVKTTPAETPEGKFLNAVRAAACGPFKTVLGPGSDADHAFHFHFDLAQRRNGGTYCQ